MSTAPALDRMRIYISDHFCMQPSLRFAEKITGDRHILPDLCFPDHSDLSRGLLVYNIVFPAVHGCDLDPLAGLVFIPFRIGFFDLGSQRKQDRNVLGMIPAYLYIQQVFSKLHCLCRKGIEICDIVQVFCFPDIPNAKISSVGIDEFSRMASSVTVNSVLL